MRPTLIFLAAALLSPPAHAIAQSNDSGEVDVGDGQQGHDGTSKLGLLGLLGLVGLLGLRRREPDIHVDARREKRG
jgi:MYXO-CTERM domain-containing protein